MKKLIFFATIIAFMACNTDDKPKVEAASSQNDTTKSNITYPYDIFYSANFEMYDPKYSQMILNIWKAWDEGDILKARDFFADSVELYFAGGDIILGHRDSVMAALKSFRSKYSSIKSEPHAIMSVKSKDHPNESWVNAWGVEYFETIKGEKDSTSIQESWLLNNEGKIKLLFQFQKKIK